MEHILSVLPEHAKTAHYASRQRCCHDLEFFCVMQDLLTNPLIVPVKILRGHRQHEHEGVLGCSFHPQQPWIFTAGADGEIALFGN